MLVDEPQALAFPWREKLDLRVLPDISLAHSENNNDSHAVPST